MGILITIIILISFAIAIPWMVRSITWNKAMKLLKNGKDKEAEEIFASKRFEALFGKFSSRWNLIRISLARDNEQEIENRLNDFFDEDFKRDQKVTVAKAAYFYFIDKENAEVSRRLLNVIEESRDKKEVKQNQMVYRVLIEKKSEDIDDVKALLEEENAKSEKDNTQIGLLQYLLGIQYLYLEQKDNAKTYLNRAKNNLKGTPYNKKIKELLNS